MNAEIDGELLNLRLRVGDAIHPHRTLTQLQRVLSGGTGTCETATEPTSRIGGRGSVLTDQAAWRGTEPVPGQAACQRSAWENR